MSGNKFYGGEVEGWVSVAEFVEIARHEGRESGLRAALEAAIEQQSEDFGTANYGPSDELEQARDDGILDVILAIERLLEERETKGGKDA